MSHIDTVSLSPDDATDDAETQSHWPGVGSLTLGVFGLVTAEFLPASLLTPMAQAFGASEGQTGQAVTVTAAVALVSGLLVPSVTRALDRRHVLLGLSALLILSDLLCAVAPALWVLLLARVILGIALGAFWALAAALAMRLVVEAHIPRALSAIFLGVPIATVTAAALGSYLGDIMGWRNVFVAAGVVGGAALLAQAISLPTLKPQRPTPLRVLIHVLARPGIGAGIAAIVLVFCGHFMFFTYVRPFLETVSGAGIDRVSLTLLGFGLANLIGTIAVEPLMTHRLRRVLLFVPVAMAVLAILLVAIGGQDIVLDTLLVALWGLAFGALPVAWSTWITRAVPDEAESAGGLMGAAVQLAIASGAAIGGLLYDGFGIPGDFGVAAVVLALAAVLIVLRVRTNAVGVAG